MPKFHVKAHQYVEMCCELEVEARSAQEARDIAFRDGLAKAAWTGGDDAHPPEIYEISEIVPAAA